MAIYLYFASPFLELNYNYKSSLRNIIKYIIFIHNKYVIYIIKRYIICTYSILSLTHIRNNSKMMVYVIVHIHIGFTYTNINIYNLFIYSHICIHIGFTYSLSIYKLIYDSHVIIST